MSSAHSRTLPSDDRSDAGQRIRKRDIPEPARVAEDIALVGRGQALAALEVAEERHVSKERGRLAHADALVQWTCVAGGHAHVPGVYLRPAASRNRTPVTRPRVSQQRQCLPPAVITRFWCASNRFRRHNT